MSSGGWERLLSALETLRDKRFFFVVGVPKSGTTWAQLILDAHPEALCKGEAHIAGLLRPALGEALDKYNREAPKRLDAVHAAPRFSSMDLDAATAAATTLVLARWAEESGKSGLKAIGEKTPDNVHALTRLDAMFPAAHFLHVIRDPRDGAVSGWAFNMRHAAEKAIDRFGSFDDYAVKYAEVWAGAMGKADDFARTAPDRLLSIRYEDLLERPAELVASMLGFLGLDSGAAHVEACVAATSFSRLSGGRSRGTEDAQSFYRKGIAGDWRAHMSPELEGRVREAAGDTFVRLGYMT